MIEGVTRVPGVKLSIVGEFNPKTLPEDLGSIGDWSRVSCLGWKDRSEVATIMSESIAGMLLYLPLRNHIESQPNKLFEYMSAGLPVICSDFPHWRQIVDAEKCGILVDPTQAGQVADAVEKLVTDRALADQMGRNGSRAVEEKYNWSTQERVLVDLYAALLA